MMKRENFSGARLAAHRRCGASLYAAARPSAFTTLTVALLLWSIVGAGCRGSLDKRSVTPRSLRDVPAERLAYNFQPDTEAPPNLKDAQETRTRHEAVQKDFDERRKVDALERTVISPDGQRALAVYETGDNRENEFRIDMYGTAGNFLRNVTPPEMSVIFPGTVAWSPDGNYIAFIGRKSLTPQPTPLPPDALPEEVAQPPDPSASVAPVFAPVNVYSTEQIYICNRDGFELKPLTTRDGLIYFYFAWAPDGHALVALACKEDEWTQFEVERRLPAGRPRLVGVDGRERLLDDGLMDALPVWSPDSSKVAVAAETDVAIYDAAVDTPTGARVSLYEPLRSASAAYDEKNSLNGKEAAKSGGKDEKGAPAATTPPPSQGGPPPKSFAPITRLEWTRPEALFIQTAYIADYRKEPKYLRWHKLNLSVQPARLSRLPPVASRRIARVA